MQSVFCELKYIQLVSFFEDTIFLPDSAMFPDELSFATSYSFSVGPQLLAFVVAVESMRLFSRKSQYLW